MTRWKWLVCQLAASYLGGWVVKGYEGGCGSMDGGCGGDGGCGRNGRRVVLVDEKFCDGDQVNGPLAAISIGRIDQIHRLYCWPAFSAYLYIVWKFTAPLTTR